MREMVTSARQPESQQHQATIRVLLRGAGSLLRVHSLEPDPEQYGRPVRHRDTHLTILSPLPTSWTFAGTGPQ